MGGMTTCSLMRQVEGRGEIKMKSNQSYLMTAYNYARWYGLRTGQFDTGRVDRAFSYLQSGKCEAKWVEYETTTKYCGCPDSLGAVVDEHGDVKATWQGAKFCKHQIALMIQMKVDRLMKRDRADDEFFEQAEAELAEKEERKERARRAAETLFG